MVAFSKFFTGQRRSRQLLDTDGFTSNQRKDRITPDGCSTWRCSKNRSKKWPCSVYFNPAAQASVPRSDRNARISLPMPNAMPGPRFRGQIARPGFSSDATYIAKPGNRFLGRNAVRHTQKFDSS